MKEVHHWGILSWPCHASCHVLVALGEQPQPDTLVGKIILLYYRAQQESQPQTALNL